MDLSNTGRERERKRERERERERESNKPSGNRKKKGSTYTLERLTWSERYDASILCTLPRAPSTAQPTCKPASIKTNKKTKNGISREKSAEIYMQKIKRLPHPNSHTSLRKNHKPKGGKKNMHAMMTARKKNRTETEFYVKIRHAGQNILILPPSGHENDMIHNL